MDRDKLSNLNRGAAIDASHPVSVHLAKQFSEEKIFRNQPIRNKNCLWRPCLLTDRDEMSNLYRGPSKDVSYLVTVHLAKRFQRRRIKNQPIRNKNRLWRPCLLTDRDEMSIIYRGPSIDVSYQVSVHLAKRFQRRRYLKICQSETNLPVAAMFVNGSDEMSKLYRGPSIDASYQVSVHSATAVSEKTIFRNRPIRYNHCLLAAMFVYGSKRNEQYYRGPSIDASYQVSVHLAKQQFQRRRFLEIDPSETRTACGGHVC